MKKKLEIIIATHKPYEFPQSNIYRPIHVGRATKENGFGVEGDDSDDNISLKNGAFCELTALYFVWKNTSKFTSEYIGLVHYRRYFKGKGYMLKGKGILSEDDAMQLLATTDCILPKKRKYYIETVRSHYKNAHIESDLDEVESIIGTRHPEYLESLSKVLDSKELHLYNMFVMRRVDFDAYCEWMFDILFELEKRIDINGYDAYQKRVFGFLSERLFNVWILKNQLKPAYVPVCNIEGENLLKKAIGLLKRKFIAA